MQKAEAYRAKAEEMRGLARTAPDPLTKAEYLKLAQSWDELARDRALVQEPKPAPG